MLRTLSRMSHGAGWRCHTCVALVLALTLPSIAAADVVTDWNVIIEAVAFRIGGGPPQPGSRIQAIAQIAIRDAINSIEPRYARYTGTGEAYQGASPDAAVAAAGHKALVDLLAPLPSSPQKQAAIDMVEAAYLATVGPAPYDAATQAGIDAGEAAAGAILARCPTRSRATSRASGREAAPM